MKITIDDTKITPEMVRILKKWQHTNPDVSEPECFIKWLGEIQDCLCRVLVNDNEIDNKTVKDCLSHIIYIKEDLKEFILIK